MHRGEMSPSPHELSLVYIASAWPVKRTAFQSISRLKVNAYAKGFSLRRCFHINTQKHLMTQPQAWGSTSYTTTTLLSGHYAQTTWTTLVREYFRRQPYAMLFHLPFAEVSSQANLLITEVFLQDATRGPETQSDWIHFAETLDEGI